MELPRGDAVIALLALLKPFLADRAQRPIVIADALWCSRMVTNALASAGYGYVIAVKSNNGFVPNELLTLAKSDLSVNKTHTYINGSVVLEVTGREYGYSIG